MSEEKQEKQNSENGEKPEGNQDEKSKAKFTFKCTKCNKCCLARGPIPITFWDVEQWARNNMIANFLPYLEVFNKPDGGFDLILKPIPSPKEEGEKDDKPQDPFATIPIEDLLEKKCPMFNKEKGECLIYENRPLSCRTYPLEFDGEKFSVVDVDCPGIGEGSMTKEELKEMRETAKNIF